MTHALGMVSSLQLVHTCVSLIPRLLLELQGRGMKSEPGAHCCAYANFTQIGVIRKLK